MAGMSRRHQHEVVYSLVVVGVAIALLLANEALRDAPGRGQEHRACRIRTCRRSRRSA